MTGFTDTNIDPEPEPEKNGFERRQAVKERDYRFRAAALIRAEWSDEQLQTELDAITKAIADRVAAGRVTKTSNNIFNLSKD